MKTPLVVRARFIVETDDNDRFKVIEDGLLTCADGMVTSIGRYTEPKAKAVLDRYGNDLNILGSPKTSEFTIADFSVVNAVVFPGFVKAHGHDFEAPIIGLVKNQPLTAWLDGINNVFSAFLNEEHDSLFSILGTSPHYLSNLKSRMDDIYYGITSGLDHHCNHNKYRVADMVAANDKAGTRLVVAVGSQDRNCDRRIIDDPKEIAIKRLDSYYRDFDGKSRVTIIPGPDQIFSNGPELLKAQKHWAKDHGSIIHIHSSEEPGTTAWFTKTYGMTPVEYADSIGFLDKQTLLAHQVNCTNHDLEILAERGVKIVHNPLANTILGSGMPPLLEMDRRGILFAIATDGSGSSDNQNILNAARVAAQYQKAYHKDPRVLPADDILRRITSIPADLLGFNSGRLKKGNDADFVLIDLSRPNLVPTTSENLLENLIWSTDGSEIIYVVAKGKILLANKRFTTIDVNWVLEGMEQITKALTEYRRTHPPRNDTGANRQTSV